jgi:hypothetical protein
MATASWHSYELRSDEYRWSHTVMESKPESSARRHRLRRSDTVVF